MTVTAGRERDASPRTKLVSPTKSPLESSATVRPATCTAARPLTMTSRNGKAGSSSLPPSVARLSPGARVSTTPTSSSDRT
eukprot:scaffold279136_cov36-Tisochrysis_lutea.AAC.2